MTMGVSITFYIFLVSSFGKLWVIFGEELTEISITRAPSESENATLESVFSTIDDNSTYDENFTTTVQPITHKTTQKPTTVPPTTKSKIKTFKFSSSSTRTCICDIQDQICDINCCCDKDCTYNMRQIFDRCNDDMDRMYDKSFCEYTKFIYKNNTPYEWSVNQNGLFCVVKTNLPREYYMHEETKIKYPDDAFLAKQSKFSWSSKSIQVSPNRNVTHEFSYGKPTWIVKDNIILPWVIPNNFHTDSCSTIKHIKLLQDMETKCTQHYINDDNVQLGIGNYISNISVMTLSSSTTYFNQKRLSLLQHCPKDVCKNYDLFLCNKFLQNCTSPNENSTLKHNCYKGNATYSCTNLLHKLQYNIYHNGSQGIKKINVLVHLMNVSYSIARPTLRQQFSVRFLWTNYSFNYSLQRSGNPGYIFGKPIIVANLVEERSLLSKKNVSTNVTIQRNALDISDNFLSFPANQKGKCVLTNNINHQIKFGVNSVTNCKLQELAIINSKKPKETCQAIQKSIFKFWSLKLNNSTKLFGKYGNANIRNFKDWKNVSYSLEPESILKQVDSVFIHHKFQLNCINLCTKLKIDIFHARSIVADLHNQKQIVWITYVFDEFNNFTFHIDSNKVLFVTPLRSEVTFYDITTKKFRKYAEPPALDIKLPYDFFYPFVKIENNADTCKPYFLLVLVMFAKML